MKQGSIIELIGCSMEESTLHLESLWLPGMSWGNYGHGEGKWVIDHVIPCCAFDLTDQEQVKKCYHYTNMRPLWWMDNLTKGAKLENGTDARVFHQTKNYQKIKIKEKS